MSSCLSYVLNAVLSLEFSPSLCPCQIFDLESDRLLRKFLAAQFSPSISIWESSWRLGDSERGPAGARVKVDLRSAFRELSQSVQEAYGSRVWGGAGTGRGSRVGARVESSLGKEGKGEVCGRVGGEVGLGGPNCGERFISASLWSWSGRRWGWYRCLWEGVRSRIICMDPNILYV